MDSDKDIPHSDLRKMFVGGLSEEHTTEAGVAKIKEYFSKHGVIDEVVVLKKENPHGARLFGFVTFTQVDDCEKVFKTRPHYLEEGKELEVKRAVPKGPLKEIESHTYKTNKLFIANIPTDTGLEPSDIQAELQVELEAGLSSRENDYGWISAPVLVYNKDPEDGSKFAKDKAGHDALRGIGFVTCDSEDVADRLALTRKSFQYKGKTIEVKKSYENSKMAGRGRGGTRGGARGGARGRGQQQYYGGGGGYGYGGYGGGYAGYGQGGYGQYGESWYAPPAHAHAGGKPRGRGRGGQQQYHPQPY